MSATVFFAAADELATLTNTFTVSNVLTDPTTVSLIVTDPNGVATTYTYSPGTITRVSTGKYTLDVSCPTDGLWTYEWDGSGAASDVVAGTWTVQPVTPRNMYCSVEQLKSRLGITDTQDDFECQLAVQYAAGEVERMTGRYFWNGTATRTYRPSSIYDLEIDDLISVTQLATDQDGDGVYETVWTASQYQLEVTEHEYNPMAKGEWWPYTKIQALGVPGGNYLPYVWAWSHQDRVQIQGSFGWKAVPVSVRNATLVIAAEFFKMKDAPAGMPSGVTEYGPQVAAMLSRYVRSKVKVGI